MACLLAATTDFSATEKNSIDLLLLWSCLTPSNRGARHHFLNHHTLNTRPTPSIQRFFLSICRVSWIYTPILFKSFIWLIQCQKNKADKTFKNYWYPNWSDRTKKNSPTTTALFVSAPTLSIQRWVNTVLFCSGAKYILPSFQKINRILCWILFKTCVIYINISHILSKN